VPPIKTAMRLTVLLDIATSSPDFGVIYRGVFAVILTLPQVIRF